MTVQQTLRDAQPTELYRDGTRAELQGQFVEAQTVDYGGRTYNLSRISYYDTKIFADELDAQLRHGNPFIFDIFTRWAVNCLDVVRMVNVNTSQGFRGSRASGNELNHIRMHARQFFDPDNSGTARVSWNRTISTTGSKPFFEGATTNLEYTLGENEGLIFLGWYNPSLTPLADAYQIRLNTEDADVVPIDFEMFDDEGGDKVMEFRQPYILAPEQSGRINVYYYRTGEDEMRPLGLYVKRSRDLRDLTDVRAIA